MINPLKSSRTTAAIGALNTALSILLGAFAAHGVQKYLSPVLITTFKTGVQYQLIHGLALILLALLNEVKPLKISPKMFTIITFLFLFGIILFSFNCYLYAFTQIKFLAHLVPIGGLSFIFAWVILSIGLFKSIGTK